MAGSKPISIRKRIGTALTRSPSNLSDLSETSLNSPSSTCSTTPATTDSELSPSGSRDISRAGSPTPPLSLSIGTPTSSSVASSWFSRLTMSSPRSDPFEAYQADKRRREKRQQKAVERKIKEFHSAITGAVFVGTVVHFTNKSEHHATSAEISSEGDERHEWARWRDGSEGTHRIGVVNIAPKEPPPPRSSKAQHYETFTSYYNSSGGEPLECFFDVFMKSVPREGARVSFIVTPTGDDDAYVAVACNIVDRYTPVRVNSKPKPTTLDV